MRQFKAVFKFEYTNFIKSKSFIVTTIIILMLVVAVGSIPFFQGVYGILAKSKAEDKANISKSAKAAIVADENIYTRERLEYLGKYEWVYLKDFSDIENRIMNDEYALGVYIADREYILYQKGADVASAADNNIAYKLNEMVKYMYQHSLLTQKGLTDDEIIYLFNVEPTAKYVTVGKNASRAFLLGYVLLLLLFYTIMAYGSFVSSSVVSEKSSKAMELLITSAKPIHLIFGKVFGTGCAGLTQFGLIVIVAFSVFKVNSGYWQASPAMNAVVNMYLSPGLIVCTVVFFLLGFFTYAFVFAALGSVVSRVEDENATKSIPIFIFIAALFVAMYGGAAAPEAVYMKICSYAPFFSPLVMFMRICITDVSIVEIILSIAVNILYIFGIGFISTKIYRVGVMTYGSPPKIKDLLRYIKEA